MEGEGRLAVARLRDAKEEMRWDEIKKQYV